MMGKLRAVLHPWASAYKKAEYLAGAQKPVVEVPLGTGDSYGERNDTAREVSGNFVA